MIYFHPKPGALLMCDFNTGFKPPEMVKVRPVVIVSRERKRGQLAVVVPLSATEPVPFEACHYEMPKASLPAKFQDERCWAKCDMVTCVAFWRLDRICTGKCPKTGKRLFISPQIAGVDLEQIRKALRSVLQL